MAISTLAHFLIHVYQINVALFIINGLVFLRQGYQLTTQMLLDTGNSFSRALLPLEATGTDYTSAAAAATPAGPKPNHHSPIDGQEKVEKDKSTMKITR